MKAVARASQVYRTLGNTGLAWYFGHRATCLGDDYIKQHEIDLIVQEVKSAQMERWHHPEPKLVDKWDATDLQMQIRGVWKKINIEGITKPRGRHSFAGWIWRGRMYVAGGEYDIKSLDDFWCVVPFFLSVGHSVNWTIGVSTSTRSYGVDFRPFR